MRIVVFIASFHSHSAPTDNKCVSNASGHSGGSVQAIATATQALDHTSVADLDRALKAHLTLERIISTTARQFTRGASEF
jgi:hypothetical protein